ncbi:MFS transporter [Salinifilum aidingensis]
MTTLRTRPAATGGRTFLPAMVLAVAGYQVNATMLTPALPDVIARLRTTSELVGLSQTLFFLFAAVGQVCIARASDRWGRRRLLLMTLGILIIGDVLAAAAPTIHVYIAGRVLQGVSAASFALVYLIMHEMYPPHRFGRALGLVTAINGGIAGCDAVIGGSVADLVGFRGIFAVTALLSLVALLVVHRAAPDCSVPTRRAPDWRGMSLLGLGLAGVVLGLNQSGAWGWSSPATLGLLLAGVLLLGVFFRTQRTAPNAIIDASVVASRRGWPVLLTTTFLLAGVFGLLNFAVPLIAQTPPPAGFGMSAAGSALLLLAPASMIGLVVAPLAGHFAPRIGWHRSVLIGCVGTAAALVALVLGSGSITAVAIALAVLGVTYTGYGLTALSGLAVELAPADKPGSLPGLNGACFGVGAALGIAASTSAVGTLGGATPAAFHAAIATAAGFGVLAVVSALFIRPDLPAEKNGRDRQH